MLKPLPLLIFLFLSLPIILTSCLNYNDLKEYTFIRTKYVKEEFHQLPEKDTNKVNVNIYEIASKAIVFNDRSPYLLMNISDTKAGYESVGIYSFVDSNFYYSFSSKGNIHSFFKEETVESNRMLSLMQPYIKDTNLLYLAVKGSFNLINNANSTSEFQLFHLSKAQKILNISSFHF